jgi:hypothetical protein
LDFFCMNKGEFPCTQNYDVSPTSFAMFFVFSWFDYHSQHRRAFEKRAGWRRKGRGSTAAVNARKRWWAKSFNNILLEDAADSRGLYESYGFKDSNYTINHGRRNKHKYLYLPVSELPGPQGRIDFVWGRALKEREPEDAAAAAAAAVAEAAAEAAATLALMQLGGGRRACNAPISSRRAVGFEVPCPGITALIGPRRREPAWPPGGIAVGDWVTVKRRRGPPPRRTPKWVVVRLPNAELATVRVHPASGFDREDAVNHREMHLADLAFWGRRNWTPSSRLRRSAHLQLLASDNTAQRDPA